MSRVERIDGKTPAGTAEVYNRVGCQLVAAARIALAKGPL